MPGRYMVTVKGTRESWGPYSLRSAQDFARIGSQTGKPRVVKRGRKKVREYRRGKRVWPVTKAQCRGLTSGELPRANPMADPRDPQPLIVRSDSDVHKEMARIGKNYKSQLTKARRRFKEAERWALQHWGSSDVEQAARSNYIRKQELRMGESLRRAEEGRQRALARLREAASKAGWGDLVPSRNPRGGNMSRKAASRYIYPDEKKFPVGDAEHERRALAYIKAGRASPEQAVTVPHWLARHAKDPNVKREAKAAVKAWRTKGTGTIAKGLRIIRKRARKLRQKNAGKISVLVTPTRQGWSLEPAGEGPYYSYGRKLLLEAAAQVPAHQAATAVERIAAKGPLVTLRTQPAMERVARAARIRPAALGALESGQEITVRMSERLWRTLLSDETGIRV